MGRFTARKDVRDRQKTLDTLGLHEGAEHGWNEMDHRDAMSFDESNEEDETTVLGVNVGVPTPKGVVEKRVEKGIELADVH